MKNLSKRDEPQFYNILELDWQRAEVIPLLHGLDLRVLNRDEAKPSATAWTRIPPGWAGTHDALGGTLEVFVLEGDLSLEGERVGVSGFFSIPEGSGAAELRSETGAQALFYWTFAMPLEADAAVRVERVWQLPWEVQKMTNMPHGAIAKSLRLPDVGEGPLHGGPAGMLRLILLEPGYSDPQEHKHNCWEGLVFLAGDLFMPPRGVIGPGTYLGNPAEFWHAPMTSQRGALVLVQTDEAVNQPPRPYTGGQAGANGYRDTESWLETPTHREWDAIPDYAAIGDASEWSDLAPREPHDRG